MPAAMVFLALVLPVTRLHGAGNERIDSHRDIRPILSEACFQCHGPDDKQRKADLRLDKKDSAFADLGEHRAIEPRKPEESEVYLRITAQDPKKRMPPAKSGQTTRPRRQSGSTALVDSRPVQSERSNFSSKPRGWSYCAVLPWWMPSCTSSS